MMIRQAFQKGNHIELKGVVHTAITLIYATTQSDPQYSATT
jgi:hypothetical protein